PSRRATATSDTRRAWARAQRQRQAPPARPPRRRRAPRRSLPCSPALAKRARRADAPDRRHRPRRSMKRADIEPFFATLRDANPTGLAIGKTPIEVEMRLLERVPEAFLPNAHHWLILHGRYVCQAKRPLCEVCAVVRWCDSAPPALKRAATPASAGS